MLNNWLVVAGKHENDFHHRHFFSAPLLHFVVLIFILFTRWKAETEHGARTSGKYDNYLDNFPSLFFTSQTKKTST